MELSPIERIGTSAKEKSGNGKTSPHKLMNLFSESSGYPIITKKGLIIAYFFSGTESTISFAHQSFIFGSARHWDYTVPHNIAVLVVTALPCQHICINYDQIPKNALLHDTGKKLFVVVSF